MKITYVYFLGLLFQLFACQTIEKKNDQPHKNNTIKYAEGLSIQAMDGYSLVTINTAANKALNYILFTNEKPAVDNIDEFIKVPIQSIICTSTSHLPAFDLLKAEHKLIGFPSTEWIYDSSLVENVKKGALQDVGQKQGMNEEKILSLKPDAFMAYQMPGTNKDFSTLQQSNISIIYNADFLETTPLGRAEWIKLTAALLGKEALADSIFKVIEQNYLQYKLEVATLSTLPHVMTGLMYGDTWYMPGGKSYASRFITDAAGGYIWNNNQETGSLALGFENVLDRAQNAEFWIGVGSVETYEELAQTDERYTYFEAFEKRKIFSYTKRVNAKGGNDYLESGYSRPDLVLKDYIKMLHPEIPFSKSSDFTYFEALK